MKAFLSLLCVALVIQLGSAFTEGVPDRFKAGQGLQFDQDAADKAATRSITSSEPDSGYWLGSLTPTHLNSTAGEHAANQVTTEDEHLDDAALGLEAETPEQDAAVEDGSEYNGYETEGENVEEEKLAARDIDSVENDDEWEDLLGQAVTDQDLEGRGLLESGMNMVPTNLRETAANLGQQAANMKDTAVHMISNPQAARESIQNALTNAKERVLNPELRKKIQSMYQSGLDQGLNMYKQLNQRLSPDMSRTLNQGVSSAIRGVNAAKESTLAKKISEKLSSFSN